MLFHKLFSVCPSRVLAVIFDKSGDIQGECLFLDFYKVFSFISRLLVHVPEQVSRTALQYSTLIGGVPAMGFWHTGQAQGSQLSWGTHRPNKHKLFKETSFYVTLTYLPYRIYTAGTAEVRIMDPDEYFYIPVKSCGLYL